MNKSIQPFRRGRTDRTALRDEDWKFAPLFGAAHETLMAACWYEYARESQHVYQTMRRWLFLQRLSERLLPFMETICKGLADAGHEFTTDDNQKLTVTEEDYRHWANRLMLDCALQRSGDLPRPLCKAFVTMYGAEKEVEEIESRAGARAPRLRGLAKHIVADTPWLLIPEADRETTINSRFVDRYDVPNSSGRPITGQEATTYFGPVWAFERVFWSDFPQPRFSEDDLRNNRDLQHRVIVFDEQEDQRLGLEFLPARIQWRLSDGEILEDFKTWLKVNRPEKWKHLAKNSGRGPTEKRWWIAALKELAAMRLCAHYPQDRALAKFNDEAFEAAKSIDQARLGQLRRNAGKTFQHFFPFEEAARSAKTATRRKK